MRVTAGLQPRGKGPGWAPRHCCPLSILLQALQPLGGLPSREGQGRPLLTEMQKTDAAKLAALHAHAAPGHPPRPRAPSPAGSVLAPWSQQAQPPEQRPEPPTSPS